MKYTILQFIPIIILFLLLSYPEQFVLFSNLSFGRLIAVLIIIFYSSLDKYMGLFVCGLVILFYQSDYVENMRAISENFMELSYSYLNIENAETTKTTQFLIQSVIAGPTSFTFTVISLSTSDENLSALVPPYPKYNVYIDPAGSAGPTGVTGPTGPAAPAGSRSIFVRFGTGGTIEQVFAPFGLTTGNIAGGFFTETTGDIAIDTTNKKIILSNVISDCVSITGMGLQPGSGPSNWVPIPASNYGNGPGFITMTYVLNPNLPYKSVILDNLDYTLINGGNPNVADSSQNSSLAGYNCILTLYFL
jgi:hypothetical protein